MDAMPANAEGDAAAVADEDGFMPQADVVAEPLTDPFAAYNPAAGSSLREHMRQWASAGIPKSVGGSLLEFEHRARTDGSIQYARWRVRCKNPRHRNCGKSRTIGSTTTFGVAEIAGYLHAWLLAGNEPPYLDDGFLHRLAVVTSEDVQNSLTELGLR